MSRLLHASRYASRSSRDAHLDVLPDKRDTARHWLSEWVEFNAPPDTMYGLDRVSCHDARSGIWAIPVHATCVGGNRKSTRNIIHRIEHLRLQRMWLEVPFLASSDDPTRKHTWLKPTRLHNTHLIAMSELSIHKPTLRTHVWKSVTTVTTAP